MDEISRGIGVTPKTDQGAELRSPVDYRFDPAGVAWITLNRPDRLNAITDELVHGVVDALSCASSDDARAVVMRGRGRAFCAGQDLLEQDDGPGSRSHGEALQDVTRGVRRLGAPVIAAVHGYALGGGFEFVLACDLVVAARSAVFGFPEVGVGLSVTGGVTMLLPRLVGPLRAKQLLLLGERLDATQALQLGLVNWVVDDVDVDRHVDDLVKRLLDKPDASVALAKKALDIGLDNTLEAQLEAEVAHLVLTGRSREARTAALAFRAAHDGGSKRTVEDQEEPA